MPTDRNPSQTLSQSRLDAVIDKLTEGKHCKVPPRVEDVWATGMMSPSEQVVRDYVTARWGLTPAGTTMRTRKLISRMSPYRRAFENHPNAVWRVKAGYYSDSECFVTGQMSPTLKEGAWLMWGWLFTDNARQGSDLRFEMVGLGGNREALLRNQSLVGKIEQRIERYKASEIEAQKGRKKFEDILEQVRGMNSMMTAAVAEEVLG